MTERLNWTEYKNLLIVQSYLSLCNPMDCSPSGFSVHRILQTGILEWIAPSFSRGTSWPRDPTQVSCIPGRFFTIWAAKKMYMKIKTVCVRVCVCVCVCACARTKVPLWSSPPLPFQSLSSSTCTSARVPKLKIFCTLPPITFFFTEGNKVKNFKYKKGNSSCW